MALSLFFDVDHEGFADVHGLVEEGFAVINHGLSDEGKPVKNMEDDVVKSALIIPFIQVPEFCKIIIQDCIDEKILEDHLHCEGSIVCFFQMFMLRFMFGSTHSHSAGWDVRIWSRVTGDDEVVAIACRVRLILHHEAKMSPQCRDWRL